MTVFQAIIYGIIQGLGEFLPISSTAHLIAFPLLFEGVKGWGQDPGLAFDVALHIGTLFAVVAFFWKDWINLLAAGLTRPKKADGKLFWFLVAASVPGAIIGKLLEEHAESSFRNLALIGVMMIAMGLVLYAADRFGRKIVTIEKTGLARSLIIGFSQALAILPGVSRSGVTMSAGLFLGLKRESAARFSFLLSTPIIAGAALLKIKDIVNSTIDVVPFAVGVLTAAIVGLLSIKFLLDYLKNKGFGIFVVYRLVVGLIFIAVYLIRL